MTAHTSARANDRFAARLSSRQAACRRFRRIIAALTFLALACFGVTHTPIWLLVVAGAGLIAFELILRYARPTRYVGFTELVMLVWLYGVILTLLDEYDMGFSFAAGALVTVGFAMILFVRGWRMTVLLLLALAGIGFISAIVELIQPPAVTLGTPRFEDARQEGDPMNVLDPDLGWKMKPNVATVHIGYTGPDEEEWHVVYRTDAKGRRVVPGQPPAGPAILMFGGSYTFGHALDDEDTLPARLQAYRPQNRVFNYGARAYGTAHSMIQLQRVDESNIDWVIYLMIDHHFNRNAGDPAWRVRFPTIPRFRLDDDGQLVRFKPGLTERFIDWPANFFYERSYLFQQALRAPLVRMPEPRKADLTAAMIRQMRTDAEARINGGGRFLVVLLPASWHEGLSFRQKMLVPLLERDGVAYLDLTAKLDEHLAAHPDLTRRSLYDRSSNHPVPLLADLFAQWCAGYIEKIEGGGDPSNR